MKTLHKAAICLLIAIFLFAIYYLLALSSEPIIHAAFFLTVFLISFLFFNLRQDPVCIVQHRMKRLLISLIEQFYEQKAELDWTRWIWELKHRQADINAQITKDLKPQDSKEIQQLLEKAWDELIPFVESEDKAAPLNGEAEVLEELESAASSVDTVQQTVSRIEFDAVQNNNGDVDFNLKDFKFFNPYESLKVNDDDISQVEEIPGMSAFSSQLNKIKGGPNCGLFISGRQYFTITGSSKIENLEVVYDLEKAKRDSARVIEERGGVHFINKRVLKTTPGDRTLNHDFKSLVDSVLKP